MKTVILIVLVLAGSAFGQSTAPSEADDLRRIIRQLQQQVAALKAENAALRRPVTTTRPAANVTTFTQRADRNIRETNMAAGLANDYRARARQMDAAVGKYLAGHETPPELADAMWGGLLKPGMTEEAMQILGNAQLLSESESQRVYGYQANAPSPMLGVFDVAVSSGRVTQVTMRVNR